MEESRRDGRRTILARPARASIGTVRADRLRRVETVDRAKKLAGARVVRVVVSRDVRRRRDDRPRAIRELGRHAGRAVRTVACTRTRTNAEVRRREAESRHGADHRQPRRRRPGATQLDRGQDHHRPRRDRPLRRLDPRRRPQAPARRDDPGPAGPRRCDPAARPRQRLHADPARRRARAAGLLARFARARPDRADRDPARADGRDRRARDRRHDQHRHARGLHEARQRPAVDRGLGEPGAAARRSRGRATSSPARGRSTTR